MTGAAGIENLGIVGWDAYEFIVSDLERSRRFYTDMMKVPEVAALDPAYAAATGDDAVLFAAGKAKVVCVTPRERGSRAERWLAPPPRRCRGAVDPGEGHPARPADAGRARRHVLRRHRRAAGRLRPAVALGSRSPRRSATCAGASWSARAGALPPGFRRHEPAAGDNPYAFQVIDHVTSNFLTIRPYVTWLRDVLGFEEYWRVHFHTSDLRPGGGGSGLASIVMWDKSSGIKLANNEPAAPNYEASQIYTFVEANHGPGVQHVAFHVPSIVPAVDGLRRAGLEFLDTPATYYDMLPERLASQKVTNFREDMDTLRRLGVLVDGDNDRYLLQIFMVEGGLMYDDSSAGPFFYEVIQRRGAQGFGEGNFRALFEAIERNQEVQPKPRTQLDGGAGS